MSSKLSLIGLFVLLGMATSRAQLGNMSPKDGIVLTEKEAYALMPPELVAATGVRQAIWSPDGQYVLLLRDDLRLTPEKIREMMGKTGPPPGNNIISVWDRKERRLIDAWKQPMTTSNVYQLQWLPGSSLAIAKVNVTVPPKKEGDPGEYHDGIIRIGVNGSIKTVSDSASTTSYVGDYISPVDPLIVFHEFASMVESTKNTDGKEVRQLKVLKDNLIVWKDLTGLSAPISFPTDMRLIDLKWAADGSPVLECFPRGVKLTAKPEYQRLALNLKTGRLTPITSTFRTYSPSEDVRPLKTKQVRTAVREGETSRQLPFLWLESVSESAQPRAMVAANADFGSLSPKSDAVLYVAHGAAWVTPLFKMSKEEYLAALEASQRMVAISNAKQLGLGLLMYAQDYDEKLPGADGELNGKIKPYLGTDALFDGFVYTYGGGPLSDINAPAEMELGYVNGPNGRAIIYADGHVKWKKD